MRFSKTKKNNGFALVEVVVAISIIVVAILAAMSVTGKAIFLARESLHQSQAAFLLEEGAEIMRITRDNGWSGVLALNPALDYYPVFSMGAWTLSNTPSQVGIFTRKINITTMYRDGSDNIATSGTTQNGNTSGVRKITITVTWNEGGEVMTKTLSFYISDIFS